MSASPYTAEQVDTFHRHLRAYGWDAGHDAGARAFLERLADAGITVTFPQPRYVAKRWKPFVFTVIDTHAPDDHMSTAAIFYGEGRYAFDHAERLNREAH